MENMESQVTKQLGEALGRLEKSLNTPSIAGELSQWCELAQRASAEVRIAQAQVVRELHLALLDQMIAEDPEQANRVEQLKQTDDELLKRTEALDELLVGLCDAANVVEQDEQRVADRFEGAVQTGLQLVMDIRRQEVALATWHSEALDRDRGVAG